MDADRFDELLRSLTETPTRRSALRLLASSVLGGLLASRFGWLAETEARDKRKCKKIDDKKRRRKCLKKAKKDDGQNGGQTGGQPCPACPAGQHCLANGSCAIPCTGPGTCPSGCFCADPNAEGQRYCIVGNTSCGVHATCGSTAGCLPGEQCAPCSGNNHCLTLCPA